MIHHPAQQEQSIGRGYELYRVYEYSYQMYNVLHQTCSLFHEYPGGFTEVLQLRIPSCTHMSTLEQGMPFALVLRAEVAKIDLQTKEWTCELLDEALCPVVAVCAVAVIFDVLILLYP